MAEISWELARPSGLELPAWMDPDRASPSSSRPGSFMQELKRAVGKVNALQKDSEASLMGFVTGDIKDVHTVALAMKKSSLSFKYLLAVRRKAMEAYQEITRLSV